MGVEVRVFGLENDLEINRMQLFFEKNGFPQLR